MSKYEGWTIEELIMGTNIKVGDRVEAPRHGRGTVLAIVGGDAWVRTEGKDYPLTFDVKKLKLVPKPRVGILGVVQEHNPWTDSKTAQLHWKVEAIELTPEVRERLKDLI